MCAKKSVFASTREQPGAWWTVLVTQKGEPSVEDLWKVFPHSPGDGVLRRHWEKDPMFTLKKRRRGFVIRHVGAWYRLPIKNLGLLLKIEFL